MITHLSIVSEKVINLKHLNRHQKIMVTYRVRGVKKYFRWEYSESSENDSLYMGHISMTGAQAIFT